MGFPDLAVLAEGDAPTGEHWILKAGGTSTDFYTLLETIHPDGHRDEGGMGGRPLPPGQFMNTYTGGSGQGPRRVVARTDPRVAYVRLVLTSGEQIELPPLATQPEVNVTFFATLLPPAAALASISAIDSSGRVLEPHDMGNHEEAWRSFLRRANPSP